MSERLQPVATCCDVRDTAKGTEWNGAEMEPLTAAVMPHHQIGSEGP